MLDELPERYDNASLATLYSRVQDENERALAARYSPFIRLDDNEPFRPLAAGYTVFRIKGRSPSFERTIRLKYGRHQAVTVIEYAIWWDWDINHLYELEHIWVYVDKESRVIGVEGSWHGEVKDLFPKGHLVQQGDHPLVLAAPGKHAFAPSIEQFQVRQSKVNEITSRFSGASGIAINDLYVDQIWRTPVWDRLIHSYLAQFAFFPSWNFSRVIPIEEWMLVPWPALKAWIPDRVHAWLNYLELAVGPEQYRTLRLVTCDDLAEIRRAGDKGLDMVQLNVGLNRLGLPVLIDELGRPTRTNLLSALRVCIKSQVGVYLVLYNAKVIPLLGHLLGRQDWSDYLMVGAAVPKWVATAKVRLPQYRVVLIMDVLTEDAVAATEAVNASYVHIKHPVDNRLTRDRIQSVHQNNIGIIMGTFGKGDEIQQILKLGIEAVVARRVANFQLEDQRKLERYSSFGARSGFLVEGHAL
jgi:hypothetical protein